MGVKIIIPARLNSSRLNRKSLLMLGKNPIIVAVYKRAKKMISGASVVVATDSEEIFNVCKKYGCDVVMTSSNHKSGTDRVYEASTKFDSDIIVNIQGDEPFFSYKGVIAAIDAVKDGADVATLGSFIVDEKEILDPNCVKVVLDNSGNALYFSRAPIPYNRDGVLGIKYLKHIGVYVYKKSVLKRFVELKESSVLEHIEKLEQLRLLENGIKIKVISGMYDSIGIDTQQDYENALKLL